MNGESFSLKQGCFIIQPLPANESVTEETVDYLPFDNLLFVHNNLSKQEKLNNYCTQKFKSLSILLLMFR